MESLVDQISEVQTVVTSVCFGNTGHERMSTENRTARRTILNRGADKSLTRPARKQTRKHVRDARDFNNIETRAVIKFLFPARQGVEGNSRHSDRNISLFHSWSGYGLISTPILPDQEGIKLGSMPGTRAISTTSRRELSSSFFFLQGKSPKEIHAILTETLAFFHSWSG